ncbi:MAG: serine hydrolase domain-containing protein [Bacteroidota bacterium]
MKRVLLLLLSQLLLLPQLQAQDEIPEKLDSLFKTMYKRGQFNGSVLVAEKGRVLYSRAVGFADFQEEEFLGPETIYNVGSVAKAFTAVAIMKLKEEGKLSYRDKVEKHLPNFPYADVEIHHLLVHTSGIPSGGELLKGLGEDQIATNDFIIKNLYANPLELLFTPGAKFAYSNLGYLLLAEVIEGVSGMTYKNYLQENLFDKAGMTHTGIYTAEEAQTLPNLAKGYVYYPPKGKMTVAMELEEFNDIKTVSGMYGDGNAYASLMDLYRFYVALSQEQIVKRETLNEGFNTVVPISRSNAFCYGWNVMRTPQSQVVYRGGELPGYITHTSWDYVNDRVIIMMSNEYINYLSYSQEILAAMSRLISTGNLVMPQLSAGKELTKGILQMDTTMLKKSIATIKQRPDLFNTRGEQLAELYNRLLQNNEKEKAAIIKQAFYRPPEKDAANN